MSHDSNKLLNVFQILSDPRNRQRIAFTCRCGQRWTEDIPGELHDSSLIIRFMCIKCGQHYDLHNKQLHRVYKEDTDAGQQRQTYNTIDTSKFDA